MVGITPGQDLLLVPAAEVKKKEDQKKAATAQAKAAAKEAAEKSLRERQEKAQWAKEAEEAKAKKEARAKKAAERTEAAEAKKRPEPKEAAEAKKRPEPKETAEAKKRPEPKEAAEAKKRPEPKETAEAKKRPEPKETVEAEKGPESKETVENAEKGSEPTEAREKTAPLVKRQPMPPKVKAMPKKAGKVKKVPCATGDPREGRYGASHALHEEARAQEDGLSRQGDKPRHAAQSRKPERTASPAHLGPAHQGPLCPDQGQGAAVRRGHGVRDHSGCSFAGDGAAKDATGGAKDATRSGDQDRGWFRVASAATGATKAQIADPSSQSSDSLGGMVNGFQPRWSGQQGEEEGQGREPGTDSGRAGPDRGSGWKRPCGVSASAQESTSSSTEDACLRSFSSLGAALALQEKIAFEHVCVGELDEHVVHGGLGEHGVHVGLGERGVVDQDPARRDQNEAWILRGDKDHLREECWGRLEREHVLRSHIPYNSSCPHCVRGRGLEPARSQNKEQDSGLREVQIDKFFYKGLAFLVLVLVGAFALGVVPYREVTGSRGPAAREAMLSDMSAWSRSVGLVGVGASELTVSVKSDIEGVVRNLAQSFADGLTAGAIEVVDAPVGRHAVVAERAVRTIKESANTLCAGLEQVGLEPCGKGVTYLLMHCAQVYNRYQVHPGSALSPEQRCLKTTRGPHAAYVWGAAVLATPPPSLRDKITGRYGHASYLGPEVGCGSHIVQFRLRDGSLKIARSARIRMLIPLTFEVSSLRGVCRLLPGRSDDAQKRLPIAEGENIRDLPLPNTATRGPPPEWIAENGRTPRCRACRLRGLPADKAWHTQKCRERYAEFVRNSFDPSRAILDQAPLEEEGSGGLGDLGDGLNDDLGLEVPDDLAFFLNFPHDEDLDEYEPSLPGVENEVEAEDGVGLAEPPSESELDFMHIDPEPLEALPEGERDALMSSVMYRESISFAGASVCLAGLPPRLLPHRLSSLGGRSCLSRCQLLQRMM